MIFRAGFHLHALYSTTLCIKSVLRFTFFTKKTLFPTSYNQVFQCTLFYTKGRYISVLSKVLIYNAQQFNFAFHYKNFNFGLLQSFYIRSLICHILKEIKVRTVLVHHTITAGNSHKCSGKLSELRILVREFRSIKARTDFLIIFTVQ